MAFVTKKLEVEIAAEGSTHRAKAQPTQHKAKMSPKTAKTETVWDGNIEEEEEELSELIPTSTEPPLILLAEQMSLVQALQDLIIHVKKQNVDQ